MEVMITHRANMTQMFNLQATVGLRAFKKRHNLSGLGLFQKGTFLALGFFKRGDFKEVQQRLSCFSRIECETETFTFWKFEKVPVVAKAENWAAFPE